MSEDLAYNLLVNEKVELSGELQWSNFLMRIGDWLVHDSFFQRLAGKDSAAARMSLKQAQNCFQRVLELDQDQYSKQHVRAKERIQEIEKELRDLGTE